VSVVGHSRIIVHTVSGERGLLRALATHALAWHGSEGPQSASVAQGSSLLMGIGDGQRGAGAADPGPGGAGVGGGAVPFAGGATGWAASAQQAATRASAVRMGRVESSLMVGLELESEVEATKP
jgi:hypothetical protein